MFPLFSWWFLLLYLNPQRNAHATSKAALHWESRSSAESSELWWLQTSTAKQELQVSIHSYTMLWRLERQQNPQLFRDACWNWVGFFKASQWSLSGLPQINISIGISSRTRLKDDTFESPSLLCDAIAKARAHFWSWRFLTKYWRHTIAVVVALTIFSSPIVGT